MRGDKRTRKLVQILFIQPAMALAASAVGNYILDSDDSPWTDTKTYSPMLPGYPIVLIIFMGISFLICNSKREINENPYASVYDKMNCEPSGTIASGFAITAWSTIITPAAALLGNTILNRVADLETAEDIVAANAIGGAMVGAIAGSIAILYSFIKQGTVNCCPETDYYTYSPVCRIFRPQDDEQTPDISASPHFLPSLGSLTPMSPLTPFSTTPCRDLTVNYEFVKARMEQRQYLRFENN